jgi:uracil-DNA glycosylase
MGNHAACLVVMVSLSLADVEPASRASGRFTHPAGLTRHVTAIPPSVQPEPRSVIAAAELRRSRAILPSKFCFHAAFHAAFATVLLALSTAVSLHWLLRRRRLPSTPQLCCAATGSSVTADTVFLSLEASLVCPGWRAVLAEDLRSPTFRGICQRIADDMNAGLEVFPPLPKVFAALNHTRWPAVKAVLIGQDPYHGRGQAHGLCFSVNRGVAIPGSLRNMYTELESDIPGFRPPTHGNLEAWADRGLLMLNTTLTVVEGKANSHADIRCQWFTDRIIHHLNSRPSGLVFLLWGNFAKKKARLLDSQKHRIVENAHPSPLSVARWRGCRAFSRCNAALADLGQPPIDWQN